MTEPTDERDAAIEAYKRRLNEVQDEQTRFNFEVAATAGLDTNQPFGKAEILAAIGKLREK